MDPIDLLGVADGFSDEERLILLLLAIEPLGEAREPSELGIEEARPDVAAVGRVDRDDSDAFAGRRDHPR